MARILIVEDSQTQALQVAYLLEETGFVVETAGNGMEALRAIAAGPHLPDLVVTDLEMPEMNGLQLVQEIHRLHPSVPVILMTAFGNEEIAVQALREGAATYVPKRNLERDLPRIAAGILEMARASQSQQRLLECLTQTESTFVLENDPSLISALTGHVTENLRRMKLCNEVGRIRVSVALSEALNHAIHGNLEINPALREDDERTYQQRVSERRQQLPYRTRRVHVHTRESLTEAVYVIRHEGPVAAAPTGAPTNLERAGTRGLLLMHTLVDEVRYSSGGNEITLIKRRRR